MIINIPSEGELEILAREDSGEGSLVFEIPLISILRDYGFILSEDLGPYPCSVPDFQKGGMPTRDFRAIILELGRSGAITSRPSYKRVFPEFHYENANLGYQQRFVDVPWDTILTFWGHGEMDTLPLVRFIEKSLKILREKG